MALTEIKTSGIADDAVTTDKLANAINTERTANTAKTSLEDNAVTLAKMAGGTDGQIITYDANGDPVAVGPGTDGQVLTSTGAGSPPAFEALPASNNYVHPNHSGDVTSSADGATTISAGAVDIAMLANGTDGQVITWDANGAPAVVGPGTDGQVLTSTGAGSPPAFEDAVSEGTQVKSTGESGGTKFLREDGNGTCSWQSVPAGGAALTGSTNNTITTVTGANAIQGEANLTWDGSVLRAKNTDNAGDGVIYVEGGEGANAIIEMYADEGDDDADKWLMKSTNGGGFHIQNKSSGSWVNNIVCATGNSVDLYYNGNSKFVTTNTGTAVTGYQTQSAFPIAIVSHDGAINVSSDVLDSGNCYDHIEINQGSHFNASNGRFTCPVAGVYRLYFRASIDNSNTNVRLRKNGSTLMECYSDKQFYSNSGKGSVSGEMICSCAANDYLDVSVATLVTMSGSWHKTFNFQLIA